MNHKQPSHQFAIVLVVLYLTSGLGVCFGEEQSFTSSELEFFEKKIRPALVKHCYECHSVEAAKKNKLKGGLYLDSRTGLLDGGDSGAAAIPGNASESLIIEALKYESFEMPPKGKLPEQVIAEFTKWVEMGLPDPRQGESIAAKGIDLEVGRSHWAYRALVNHKPPTLDHSVATKIDAFLESARKQRSLPSAQPATRTELVRRVYFDLHGLPPTPEQIADFVHDPSSDAFVRLVDRLLASPRFGERWGRHWLDVARYADSLTLRGFVLPQAWRYRDYVIRSLNEDRPFPDFVREQISGDLLPTSSMDERQRNVIATTFLTLGNSNLEDQDKQKLRMDVVDEQLETIGRSILAQTIGCARCHDHKFDPIPTRDYYAMAGILRNVKTLEHSNVSKWIEMPLPVSGELAARIRSHDQAVARLNNELQTLKQKNSPQGKVSATPIAGSQLPGIVVDDTAAQLTGNWVKSTFIKNFVDQGYRHDNGEAKSTKKAVFEPKLKQAGEYEVRFAYSSSSNRCPSLPISVNSSDGEKIITIDQRKSPPSDGRFISLGRYKLEPDQGHSVVVDCEGTTGVVIIDAIQFLLVEDAAVEVVLPSQNASDNQETQQQTARQIKALESELRELKKRAPDRPRSMSVREEGKIGDTQIHIRGDVHNLGETVPRGFLQVLSNSDSVSISGDQSGRREFGEWLTSDENPLPPRVLANRVWHWLFGVGLVRTTDNFGVTGETPSHPELLDYLALRLIENEWSLKLLIREIVLTDAYQMSSDLPAKRAKESQHAKQLDPENRYLWRMNRRRLDAECLQDAMLLVSNHLDLQMYGSTIRPGTNADYDYRHGQLQRRAVYWPVFRNSLPRVFEVFDFANPSLVTGRRDVSNTAPQALFMLNNPEVIRYAQAAAKSLLKADATEQERVSLAFRTILGREPGMGEQESVMRFLAKSEQAKPDDVALSDEILWAQIVQSLMASVDFRFVK